MNIIAKIIATLVLTLCIFFFGMRWQEARSSRDLSPTEELQVAKIYILIGLTEPKLQEARRLATLPVVQGILARHGCPECNIHIDAGSGWPRMMIVSLSAFQGAGPP